MADMPQVRRLATLFSNTCDWQAEWRQTRADELPTGGRHQRSADALHFLALWAWDYAAEVHAALGDLPPSLIKTGLDYLPFGMQATQLLSGYGFDNVAAQPGELLADLRAAAWRDAQAQPADERADSE